MLDKKFLLLLLFITSFVFGQNDDKKPANSIITLSLLTPTYFTAPRWNVGYMRKIDQRIWVGLELGYGDFGSSIGLAAESDEFIYKKYQLFEIHPEVYYDLRPSSKLKHLLSAELFYINHTDVLKDNWYKNATSNLDNTFQSADYKRQKYGVNINYSILLNITKRLALMPKIGFGIKHREVQFSNIIDEQLSNTDLEEDIFIPSINNYIKNQGTITNFNFNLDFKIVYRLN